MFGYSLIKTSELERMKDRQESLIKLARLETKIVTPEERLSIKNLLQIYEYSFPECIIHREIGCDEKYRYIDCNPTK